MKCPNCPLENPPDALHCDCGYDFKSQKVVSSLSLAKGGKGERQSWYWPDVRTRERAISATHQGAGAALFVAGVTIVVAILGMNGIQLFSAAAAFDAWALLDAAIFLLIAWRIYRGSRIAAVLGLLFYLFERVYMWVSVGTKSPIMTILLTLVFVNAIRGAFSLRKIELRAAASELSLQPTEPS